MNRLASVIVGIWLGVTGCTAWAADVPARVGWAQRVELGTTVSGVVGEVAVQPGQRVAKGDLLLRLDPRGFATRVSRWTAEQRYAQAALAEAQREDERAAELYDRTLLSDYERNQAAVALQAARAAAERARAELVDARLALEYSAIRAPFDGVVLAVNAAPGQSVVSELQSQPLVVLADSQRLRATAQVDATLAGALAPGTALKASAGGRTLQASVAYVGFEPAGQDAQGPSYALVADLVNDPQQPVRVGETVTLHLD